jgi:hypothetical protein
LLAFVLVRRVLYAQEAGSFNQLDRESPKLTLAKFTFVFAFLLCLAFQALQ